MRADFSSTQYLYSNYVCHDLNEKATGLAGNMYDTLICFIPITLGIKALTYTASLVKKSNMYGNTIQGKEPQYQFLVDATFARKSDIVIASMPNYFMNSFEATIVTRI